MSPHDFWRWLRHLPVARWSEVSAAVDRASGNHWYAWEVIAAHATACGREFWVV